MPNNNDAEEMRRIPLYRDVPNNEEDMDVSDDDYDVLYTDTVQTSDEELQYGDNENDFSVSKGAFIDRYGNERGTTNGDDGRTPNMGRLYDSNNIRVMGMPLQYGRLDDPNKRVFRKTFEKDLPLIFMNPGFPKIHTRLFGPRSMGGIINFNATPIVAMANALPAGIQNTVDGRLVSVRNNSENMNIYRRHLGVMAEQLYLSMGLPGSFNINSYLPNNDKTIEQGLAYFGNKGTSISESANHEYSATTTASEINSQNQEIREQQMMIAVGGAEYVTMFKDWMKRSMVGLLEGLGGVIGTTASHILETLQGQNLYYPDLWTNSLFDRTYNLEFKFQSPYGDPESIFRHVYFPFLSLLVLSLPLQDNIFSYKQPFMIKLRSPGRFEAEAGIIQSLSIIRGEDQTWTDDGYPREISVSMNIRDMYPNMMASKDRAHHQFNRGLISYLDAMSGVSYRQLDYLDSNSNRFSSEGVRGSRATEKSLKHEWARSKASETQYSIFSSKSVFY